MTIVTVILSILLAVAFLGAGVSKVTGQKAMVEAADHLGFSLQNYKIIGGLEILGAIGVLVGLGFETLGGLAALGLLVTMVGAVVFHVRKGDEPKVFAPAAGLGVLSLVVMILDLVVLRRRLSKQLTERFPGESKKGLTYYAVTRSLQMKFMRLPKSKVKIGQQLPERYT